MSDVFYLQRGLVQHYKRRDDAYLDRYCAIALARVWGAERLSGWLTNLLHVFPDRDAFEAGLNQSEFEHLCTFESA